MTLITLGPATGTDDGGWGGTFYWNANAEETVGNVGPYHMWLRCPNASDLVGATINSATLTARNSYRSSSNSMTTRIYGVAADAPAHPANFAAAEALAETTAYAEHSKTYTGGDSTVTFTGLASVIQEIVDRPGFAGVFMLQLKWQSGTNLVNFRTHENGSGVWSIAVDYTAGGGSSTLLLLGC